ncbi:SMC-Scp complex subunit ScpB [Pseudonocardia parietis]|uniref:Segregation and condensation protein B n=1 Tax=Pseudonocardia parietis TaxID=570936 RepID=A0ABS4VUZ3_9PSEU|nr:SMC-Scp complex subunit ScpB [Pseudonocardia parietis]MBP2367374.1 segregation and condensation protein B [Pseudonocardia parietis]
MPPDGAAGRDEERAVFSGHAAERVPGTAEPVAHDDLAATVPAGAGEPAAEDAEAAAPADPAEAADPAETVDPAEAVDPVDPAEAVDPVDPAEAADPAEDEDEDEAGELDEQTDPLDDLADDAELELALEALLLVVDSPIDEPSLAGALNQTPSRIRQTLNRMSLAYTADRRGIDLRRVGEGWRFYTRDRYAPYVEKLLLDGQRARLTRAALETLAVVAYRQPVTRARVSAVRGVNCDGVLRTLFTRGLVEEAGTEEQTGGTLFRTTELFLERLGLSSVQELPPLAPLLPDIDAIDDLDGQR